MINIKEEVMILENPEICRICGGSCCKWVPGAFHPSDFAGENIEEILLAGIVDKKFVIKYDANGRPYVIPNTIGNKEYGTCIFLTKSGCEFTYEKRPRECRMLEPSEGQCKTHSSKEECADGWERYAQLLVDLRDISI